MPNFDHAQVAKVRAFIRESWPKTIVQPSETKGDNIPMPVPIVVPTAGSHFHTFFYWDNYYTAEGLVRDGHIKVARWQGEGCMHLTEQLGFIPNFTNNKCHRSQIPLATRLYRLVYERTQDRLWLQRALRAAEREHGFWSVLRAGSHGLNRAGHHDGPAEVDSFYWAVRDRVRGIPHRPDERLRFLGHLIAECEIWDFTPRFAGRCMDFMPVDLNATLYGVEQDIAWMRDELGEGRAEIWRERASQRQRACTELMWDSDRGWFMDWDMASGQRGDVVSAAGLFPLFVGMATPDQAATVRDNLALIERPGGLTTCAPGPRPPGQVYQWDDPNAWPPLQWSAIVGLLRYGFEEDAQRLACTYLSVVCANFEKTGNLWEKYNAVTGGLDVADEYAMPPFLGWTAGVFVACCEVAGV